MIFIILYFNCYRRIAYIHSKISIQFIRKQDYTNDSGILDITGEKINWFCKKKYIIPGITNIPKKIIKFFFIKYIAVLLILWSKHTAKWYLYYFLLKFWHFMVNDHFLFYTTNIHVKRTDIKFLFDAYTRQTQLTD